MLTANTGTENGIQKKTAYQIHNKKGRENDWWCPICEGEVIYVREGSDGSCAHFRHRTSPNHESISESKEHREAKQKVADRLQESNNLREIELEKVFEGAEKQIADIYLETIDGKEIAVEIQCSNQSAAEFESRTEAYTQKGVHTLWLLSKDTYCYEKVSQTARGPEHGVCLKDSVRWLQPHYYGRVYLLDTEDYEVTPSRIRPKEVLREGVKTNPFGTEVYEYTERLKSIGDLSEGGFPGYGVLTDTNKNLKIARFYDRCWWSAGDSRSQETRAKRIT